MTHPDKANCQLVARCFLAKGEVKYENYDKYYLQQEEQHIRDILEMEADY